MRERGACRLLSPLLFSGAGGGPQGNDEELEKTRGGNNNGKSTIRKIRGIDKELNLFHKRGGNNNRMQLITLKPRRTDVKLQPFYLETSLVFLTELEFPRRSSHMDSNPNTG